MGAKAGCGAQIATTIGATNDGLTAMGAKITAGDHSLATMGTIAFIFGQMGRPTTATKFATRPETLATLQTGRQVKWHTAFSTKLSILAVCGPANRTNHCFFPIPDKFFRLGEQLGSLILGEGRADTRVCPYGFSYWPMVKVTWKGGPASLPSHRTMTRRRV